MPKINWLMIAPLTIFAGITAIFTIGMMREDPDNLPSARLGQVAPAVKGVSLGNKQMFDDAVLRDGSGSCAAIM